MLMNDHQPKLLLISAIAPFPQSSGGATRIYYTLKYLSKKYQIYFLAFGAASDAKNQQDFLRQHCVLIKFFPLSKRHLFSSKPYYFSSWRSQSLVEELKSLLHQFQFDQIRIEFDQIAELVQYLPATSKKSIVIHDVNTIGFARRCHEKTNLLKKLFAQQQVQQIEQFERQWLPQYDQIVAVSTTDQQILQQQFGLANVTVEPNGLTAIDFLPALTDDRPLTFGYLGGLGHPPNRTAVNYILTNIVPILEAQKINYQFILAGENDLQFDNPHLINLHRVDQVKEFFAQIDLLVAPLSAGSGSRIKILEALSFGKPVITTAIGAEGIALTSPYLQVLSPSDDWARAIIDYQQKLTVDSRATLKKQLEPLLWENVLS